MEWVFSQVKGSVDEEITEADIISCVEFSHDGDLLATGDKGGRVVIFQRDDSSKSVPKRGEYSVYTTFQSHEPEFDYLKSLEIEEKINKIKWLKRKNAAQFLLSTNDKTIKLWKISEKDKMLDGLTNIMTTGISGNHHLKMGGDEPMDLDTDLNISSPNSSFINSNNNSSKLSNISTASISSPATSSSSTPSSYTSSSISSKKQLNPAIRTPSYLRIPQVKRMDLVVEASPRKIYANAHTYHVNSISVNSDGETFLSADDLRINLWNQDVTDESFNIVDIKPANMEELTEVITAAEFHPLHCNYFVYSSSKGILRLCDMRANALCDKNPKIFEEPEDPTSRSFFSEIISSISGIKFSNNGRYLISRDYLSVKVWDLAMEKRPVESYQVHEYLRYIMTGSYNNFFKIFNRHDKRDVLFEASRDTVKPRTPIKPRKVSVGAKKKKDEVHVDSLDFNRKILYSAWHPTENIIAVAATNNLYLFHEKVQTCSNSNSASSADSRSNSNNSRERYSEDDDVDDDDDDDQMDYP